MLLRTIICLLAVLTGLRATALAAPPVQIVSAGYLGAGTDSDLQGAAIAADGTIYVVGNSSALAADLGAGIRPTQFGAPADKPRCGCGFIAHLSPDGKSILHYAQFQSGIVLLTTLQFSGNSIYVSGYGSGALEPVLKACPGFQQHFPLSREIKTYEQEMAAGKEDKIDNRPGLGRYGAPCVLKLSSDLAKLQAGTYLEGWQQVWDKKRVAKQGKEILGGYQEYYWQPTCLAVLKSGDLLVCHDGGYFRDAREQDKGLLKPGAKDDQLIFYDNCDYLSRLSADLSQRAWKQDIYTPPVDPKIAAELKFGWPYSHYGSPRTHRMRLDRDENVYLCGWSASATSKEPWWSPYLYKLKPSDGSAIWKSYEYDPMSGGGNRMGGQVADTSVESVAVDENGNLLTSLLADGGNSVMEWSPTADYSKFEAHVRDGGFGVKLVHWWGQIHRVNSDTRQGMGGARIGPWGWVADLTSLSDNSVLTWGRYNWKFDTTADAWSQKSDIENPNAFVRVYSENFDLLFSTSVAGVVPFEVARKDARIVLVGRAEQSGAPVKDAIVSKLPGKTAGYLMVLDYVNAGGK